MVALVDDGDPDRRTLQVMGELETGKSGPDDDDVMIGHGELSIPERNAEP